MIKFYAKECGNMIRIRDIKIRENLTEEKVFQKAIFKNKIKPEEVERW